MMIAMVSEGLKFAKAWWGIPIGLARDWWRAESGSGRGGEWEILSVSRNIPAGMVNERFSEP